MLNELEMMQLIGKLVTGLSMGLDATPPGIWIAGTIDRTHQVGKGANLTAAGRALLAQCVDYAEHRVDSLNEAARNAEHNLATLKAFLAEP